MNSPRTASVLSIALQVLAATAGVAALVTVVGGATLWLRFDALHLPATQAVAILPESLLAVVGLRALAVPLLVALTVAVLLVAIDPLERPGADEASPTHPPKTRFWVAIVLLMIGGGLFMYLGVEELNLVKYQLPLYGIGLLGIVLLGLSALSPSTRGRHIAYITFAIVAICGSALVLVRTAGRPEMEPIALLLKNDRGVSGFYVGQTEERLYIATLPGTGEATDPFADAPVDRVIGIPRDELLRSAIRGPTGLGSGAAGRDHAQDLLFELRIRYSPGETPAPPRTADPVGRFAPLVHLHAREQFWPTSVGAFLAASTLYFKHAECSEYSLVKEEHVEKLAARPEQVEPRVDPRRLGKEDPYSHAPTDSGCVDADEPVVKATDITRPYEPRRARGLPAGDGFFLDVAESARHGSGLRRKAGAQRYFEQVPSYFEVNSEGTDRRRITYWLFYAYSLPPGPDEVLRYFAHEGDWERLSVLVRRVDDGLWEPESVRYHFHEENRDVPWNAVRVAGDEIHRRATHPVAYVARNSHATYPRAGEYEEEIRVADGRIVSASDSAMACPDCPQWRTWHMLRDAKRQPWYGFGGAWGKPGPDSSRTGPLGPSKRKSLVEPAPTLEDLRARRQIETGAP